MSNSEWRRLLEDLNLTVLENHNLASSLPDEVLQSGWLGFNPADESAIAATEARLNVLLPASLRTFYAVTNGWRIVGNLIWDILPVEKLGWLVDSEPTLYNLVSEIDSPNLLKEISPARDLSSLSTEGTTEDNYRYEQGTRVKRSLVLNSRGDDSIWLLDPETHTPDGEWLGGRWSSWTPGMFWSDEIFEDLVRSEYEDFIESYRD